MYCTAGRAGGPAGRAQPHSPIRMFALKVDFGTHALAAGANPLAPGNEDDFDFDFDEAADNNNLLRLLLNEMTFDGFEFEPRLPLVPSRALVPVGHGRRVFNPAEEAKMV